MIVNKCVAATRKRFNVELNLFHFARAYLIRGAGGSEETVSIDSSSCTGLLLLKFVDAFGVLDLIKNVQ